MAVSPTRGFEFAYNLNGSEEPPVVRDLAWSGGAAYKVGDLMYFNPTTGYATVCPANAGTFGLVLAEATLATDAAATLRKFYVIMPGQVWRVSADASTISAKVGNKNCRNADEHTYDADQTAGGQITLVAVGSELDANGNAVAYVTFAGTVLQWG